MSLKFYKIRIFIAYCSYKYHLSYKKSWSASILSGLIWIPSLEKVLHIGGQVTEGLNSKVIGSPLETVNF